MSDPELIFFTDDEGYPWACFAWGDVPYDTFSAARIAAAAEEVDVDEEALDLDAFTVTTFWIRPGGANGDFDETWHFCQAEDDGARKVTGVRFQ